MNRLAVLLAPAVLLLLTGCPSIRESRPLADALRGGVHLERSLPKKIPDKASKVPHSQYVLIRNESAVGLLVPVPFVADVVENAAHDHAAAAYEQRYGHVDPYRIVTDAMQGSPVLARGDAGLPLQPFAFLQECVDDRFRVTLVAHLESGDTMGRYLIHLPGTYTPAEISDPSAAVLDRLAVELRAAALQLRELVERGARNDLRPSGVRADIGSLHLVGGACHRTRASLSRSRQGRGPHRGRRRLHHRAHQGRRLSSGLDGRTDVRRAPAAEGPAPHLREAQGRIVTLSMRDDPRERHLDSLPRVFAVIAAALGLYVWGAIRSPYKYTDPDFVLAYFPTELQVAVLLLGATFAWFPAKSVGWRAPSPVLSRGGLPLLLLLLAAAGAWLGVRLSLPADAGTDMHRTLQVLGTTVLVGINEEWLFRGLVLAALCRRLGLKRGALLATVLFGTFHMMNVVAGEPLTLALIQAGITTLIGAVFALAAVATRSLLWPAIGHGLYDFAVLEMSRLTTLGANAWPALGLTLLAGILGIVCLARLWRMQGGSPYERI